MSTGLRRSKALRRRQRRLQLLKWTFLTGALAGVIYLAYETGAALTQFRIGELEEQVAGLAERADRLEAENTRLKADADVAHQKQRQAQARYEREVPHGVSRELLIQVNDQLDAGVAVERLRFMIDAAGKTPECDGEPVTKRFLVRTPIYRGANDAVSFARDAITVTAEGQSMRNAQGRPEAWFDPAQPLTVKFVELGGGSTQANGPLPLHHTVLLSDREYRFTIVAGESRGFANVTADRCRLPGQESQ